MADTSSGPTGNGETRSLLTWVHGTSYDDLPESVIEKMRIYLLDTLAAGFIGSRLPWAQMVSDVAHEQGGAEEASVFATGRKMTVSQATLINGVMVGGFESEHVGHTSHPAGTVMPAALAIAERDGLSGRAFVEATALGYEVVCRIGDAQTGKVETVRGFHNPSANGPFSAAATVAKMLNFDLETLSSAFGIAGSHCGGLTEYAWDGSMTKRLHLGRASQMGLESALFAQKGFTGPATILEGRFGYFNAFSPDPKIEELLDGLGETWQLETLNIKAYPCHVTSQGVVGAIQQFKQDHPDFDPSKITAIHMRNSTRLMEARFSDPAPTNEMGAQYSLLFTTAVACYRDLDDPLQYDESVLADDNIKRLAALITTEELAGAGDHGMSAEIDMTVDGKTHTLTAGAFRGSLANPADFADMESKFRRFSKHILSTDEQDKVIELVRGLETIADMRELTALLPGTGSGSAA